MKNEKKGANVVAVVLTYNRLDCLKICIEKLINQTHNISTIFIVDNCSTDNTHEYIQNLHKNSKNINYLITQENHGPAGGFNIGMKEAMKLMPDFLWVMDDDVYAEPECLFRMLQKGKEGHLVYPNAINSMGQPVNFPSWCGVLICSKDVEKYGYPRTELFWWCEDTEYLQHRIVEKNKCTFEFMKSAVVYHQMYRSKNKASWQYYYQVRNTMYIRFYVKKFNYYKVPIVLGLIFFQILLKQKNHKLRKIKLFVLGFYHGIFAKLGKTISTDLK